MQPHPILQKLYDKYKIKGDFVNFVEIYLTQVYGHLLASFAVGLVADEALDDFDKLISDPNTTEDQKIAMLYKIINDHSTINLEEFYTHVVTIFVYHLERNLSTVVELYNKSIEMSKTPEEVEKNFLEYIQTLNDMKLSSLESKLKEKK